MTILPPSPTTVPPAPEQDPKLARKTKRAGQTCITAFVAFLIVLIAFGSSPLTQSANEDEGSTINIVSCCGIGAGAMALVFLVVNFRTIMRLGTTRKVLGLIGCLGLVTHAALALFYPIHMGFFVNAPPGTGGNPGLARGGAEDWMIDGKSYHIEGSYYMPMQGTAQYTIEYPCAEDPEKMDGQRALAIAFPLMKYAYVSGQYKRDHVTKIGQGPIATTRIGVVLFHREGTGIVNSVSGYRVALSLEEIQQRMNRDSTPAPNASGPASKTPPNSW